MGIIGIAANPASGKDIRRLVSHATNFDNTEKVNIVERIILALDSFSMHQIYLMPERFNFKERIIKKILDKNKDYSVKHLQHPYPDFNNTQEDTSRFSKEMHRIGADLLIVLGGDGTCRAAAKESHTIPLIPISTGTNNVYPEVLEGTLAGIAAAAIAAEFVPLECCTQRSKVIRIRKNTEYCDLALIDAVITDEPYAASKALWNIKSIKKVIVTQAHPANIGFSSLIGCRTIIRPEHDYGAMADIDKRFPNAKSPFAAGVIASYHIDHLTPLNTGEPYTFVPDFNGMVALDGEREVSFKSGDSLTFEILRNGPVKVDVRRCVEIAQKNNFFNISR